jgi:hypothetical protein
MDEAEKIVAAVYAAKVTWGESADLDRFLDHYDACIRGLQDRRAATKRAEVDRSIATMKQTGR